MKHGLKPKLGPALMLMRQEAALYAAKLPFPALCANAGARTDSFWDFVSAFTVKENRVLIDALCSQDPSQDRVCLWIIVALNEDSLLSSLEAMMQDVKRVKCAPFCLFRFV